MPKKRNLSKSAAALFQNEKRIELAFSAETIFGVVAKKLGNGSFHVNRSLGNGKGYIALATPRGLFTRGSMCIEVGHVVILEGVERLDGDRRAPLPMEIVARIDGKAVLEQFKKKGVLTSADYNYILATSASAGAISSEEQAIAEDDIFEAEEEDADWEQGIADLKQSSKAQRKEEETMRSIAARVGSLKSSKKGLGGSAIIGDASKPLVVEDEPQQEDEEEDYAAFLRSSKLPHAAESLKAAESADTSDLDAIIAAQKRRLGQIEAARDASLMAAEAAAAKVAMAAKSKRVLANWDDEEIAIEDL
jgi:hypothetical protein